VQLLSLYHDSLLLRAVARLPKAQQPHPSPHSRYTQYWTKHSPAYRRLALILQIIQNTELLLEMAAKRRSETARWDLVCTIESLKALCRLLLLRLTNSRPLLSPPLPQREVDPSTLEDKDKEPLDPVSPPSETSEQIGSWTMPRTGLTLPTLPSSTDISSYLLSKVLTADDIKPAKSLLHRISGLGSAAEVLYILRPVIYAFAMAYWAKKNARQGKKGSAWEPWVLGIALEYGARQMAKRDLQTRRAGGLRGLTVLEKEELKKRGWGLAWWAMRGAFYENVTRGVIRGIAGGLKGKPLLDMVGGVIEDYEFLWDQYHFPTATL